MELELYNLLHLLYNAFIKRGLNYEETRKIIAAIDLELFEGNIEQYRWYPHYREMTKDSEWFLRFKYFLRTYTKIYLRPVYDFLLFVRRKFRFLGRI